MVGDRIYVGACDKKFYCIDGKTGKEIWHFSANGPIPFSAHHEDGVVYFASYDNNIYAVSADDGELLWKADIGQRGTATLAHKGRIYIGSSNNNLYCFSNSGEKLWSFKTNGPISGTPIVYKDILYFGSWDKNFYAVNLNGELVWRFPTNGQIVDQGAVRGDVVYFGSFDSNLYAASAKTGDLLWKFGVAEAIDMVPYVTDKRVYFASHEGTCYALSHDGEEQWRFDTAGYPGFTMEVLDGILVMVSTNGNVYALSEKDGSLLWKFSGNGPMVTSKSYRNGFLISSWDCHLYYLSKKGEVIWKFSSSLGYMAPIETEDMVPPKQQFKVVFQPTTAEKRQEKKGQRVDIGRYDDDFKSDYSASMNTDYLGVEKDDGLPGKKKRRHYG